MFVYLNSNNEDVINTHFITNFWKENGGNGGYSRYYQGNKEYYIKFALKDAEDVCALYNSEEDRDNDFQELIDLLKAKEL